MMNKTIKILRFLAVLVISAGASGMEEFFDDLHYSGSADSLLKARSWHIADGKSGPPAGAFYSAAQITFSADPQNPENRIMYLAAGTEGPEESWRLARIETDLLFHEGIYAARVYFDNKLRKDRDGNLQAFYTINRLRFPDDSLYSECDMEYLPYDSWDQNGNTKSKLYLNTWESYREHPWRPELCSDTLQLSLQGWHLLLFQVHGGNCVRYYIDRSGVPLAEHCVNRRGATVYPESPMQIAFTNRMVSPGKDGKYRESRMAVDWVYFSADTVLNADAVLQRIRELQRGKLHFLKTIQ